ncbi:MAG TPA: ATP-binding protein [Novosphingobium sp.]|nr:ATP-binding protein [Novosphingobium sp.]
MTSAAVIVARGRSDRQARLLSADEPLAALQRACGGEIPGIVAIPALLELVRQAGRSRLKLARTLHAQDDAHAISAWVEVTPDDEGSGIALSHWRASPLEAPVVENGDQAGIAAQLAELHARLDPRQAVLAVSRWSEPLASVAAAMTEGAGRPWTDFVAVAGSTHRQPLHWRLLDGAEVSAPGTGEDGDARWQARILPQTGAGGSISGFDLYLVPVELDELPAADIETNEAADALDGLLGRDLAPVLRQPVARIIANAESIRTRLAGPLAEEYAGYAGDIADAARHLSGLVEDLADLEAIEAADFTLALEPLDLADAARRAAGILGVRARERSITVIAPGEGQSLSARGDYRRVLQVLLNLLGNALRYAPEGSTVRLRAARDGERAAVTVADQGVGLTDEQQTRVFDKFERLGRSGDGGSGLGLYISRRLARAMHGDLRVEGRPGEGARFTLELPSAS